MIQSKGNDRIREENKMYSGLKIQKFDMKDLDARTLEMHTFVEDTCTIVVGRDTKTGELFVIHEEWRARDIKLEKEDKLDFIRPV